MNFLKWTLAMCASALLYTSGQAQEKIEPTSPEPRKEEPKKITARSRDLIMLQLHYDDWAQKPDSINMKGLNRGFSAYIMMDFPFKKAAQFSFAAGIGVGTYNYYFSNQRLILNEGNQTVIFRNLYEPESTNYKKIKFNTAYLEAPLELRFFGDPYNRNRGFKFALGMKVGYLLSVHTKERVIVGDVTLTQKFGGLKVYNPTWTFSPTVRIGWGNFSVFGQYSLSQQFTSGLGPEVYPFSIGLTISGL